MTSTYLKAAILVALLTLLNACEEDKVNTTNCDAFIALDSDKYQNKETDFYTIISASINGNCLEVEYSSSGCSGESWTEEMVDSEEILESFPPQRRIRMLLDNKELCDAVFTKTVSFDLTPLRTEDYSMVILNLDGFDKSLLYEY